MNESEAQTGRQRGPSWLQSAILLISLRADIASFRSGMNEANQQLDTLKQHSSDAAQALQSLQRYFETVISVATIQRIADFGASLVEGAAKVGHLSEALESAPKKPGAR